MEIKISQNSLKSGILSKINYVLFGVFLTSIIATLNLRLFEDNGLITGLLSNITIIALGFYYTKPLSRLRLVTWSILVTTLLITVAGIVLIYILNKSLSGF